MPVLPQVGDDDHHLEEAVRAVKEHGGRFILAGGLSMDGVQAERTIQAASQLNPGVADSWRKMYNWLPGKDPEYSPSQAYTSRLGSRVREICQRHGLPDRMPRPLFTGKAGLNKRIAELLFQKTYDLEIQGASQQNIWAYRKAAWRVDEMEQDIFDIFEASGEGGIRAIPEVGQRMAVEISNWIRDWKLDLE